MANYDVFISFKTTNKDGFHTDSFYKAKQLYDRLKQMKFKPYMSEEELENASDSDFTKHIDSAIKDAQIFVLCIDKLEQFDPTDGRTNWMHYEWEQWAGKARSGEKDLHSMFVLGSDEICNNIPEEFTKFNLQIEKSIEVLTNKIVKKHEELNPKAVPKHDDNLIHHIKFGFDDEEERAAVDIGQAMMEAVKDAEYFKENLVDKSKKYNILEVGCENGKNTRMVFGDVLKAEANINLLSVDSEQKDIDDYNAMASKKGWDNIHAEVLDCNQADWAESLTNLMSKYGIDKFDYIYCPSILHCFTDSGKEFIRRIRRFLRDNGIIYIRSFDDSLQIAYPEDVYNKMMDITNQFNKCIGINDRAHGRKLYSLLRLGGYTGIKVSHFCVDTIDKDPSQLEFIYDSAFGFRKSVFKGNVERLISENPDKSEEYKEQYKKVFDLLKGMNEAIMGGRYFAYFMTIAIATNPSIKSAFDDD